MKIRERNFNDFLPGPIIKFFYSLLCFILTLFQATNYVDTNFLEIALKISHVKTSIHHVFPFLFDSFPRGGRFFEPLRKKRKRKRGKKEKKEKAKT